MVRDTKYWPTLAQANIAVEALLNEKLTLYQLKAISVYCDSSPDNWDDAVNARIFLLDPTAFQAMINDMKGES